jgi:hypothetical protein
MSETDLDATAFLDLRLLRDGITLSEEERARLIDLVPVAREWVKQLSFEETRYAEPILTHPLT